MQLIFRHNLAFVTATLTYAGASIEIPHVLGRIPAPGLMKCPVWKRLSGVYGCHMDQEIQSLACSEKQPRSGIAELLIRTRQC